MSIFQTPEWEKFKLQTGWQKSYRVDDVLVLQKNLPMGRTMLYSPRVSKYQVSSIKYDVFLEKIREIADTNNTIFYRLEIDDLKEKASEALEALEAVGFQKSFEEMQPEHTLVIDLSKTKDEILAEMKQKGRYNIKVAKKHSVSVKESDSIENFYSLYETTAKRQKISYRNKDYFFKLFDILKEKGYVKVFEATHTESLHRTGTEKVLAVAVVVYYEKRATYLFGGSSQEEKQTMAPYLLHWEIMKDAKENGFLEYDLFGVAPEDQPKHRWANVTSFKKKFGGNYLELVGSFDLVFKPFEYKLFKLAEKVRR